jgi:hypothetical protein
MSNTNTRASAMEEVARRKGAHLVTASETLKPGYSLVRVDTSGGAVTVTLPKPSEFPGGIITIKAIDATNATTIASAGSNYTLNAFSSKVLKAATLTDYTVIYSDGEDYHEIAGVQTP